MIYIRQGLQNTVPAVCSRNLIDENADIYLWDMEHKLTSQTFRFIPYMYDWTTDYLPGYNQFDISVDDTQPQSLTGNTVTGTTNVYLIPGEYYVTIYGQTSNSNLNPTLSEEIVYQTQGLVVGANKNTPVSYSGETDIFILYNPDND